MGSLAATHSRSSRPIGFSTAEFTPNSGTVVARSAFLRLRRSLLASVRAGLAFSGETDTPFAQVERSPRRLLNALAATVRGLQAEFDFTTRGRWPRQPRGDAGRARRKSP